MKKKEQLIQDMYDDIKLEKNLWSPWFLQKNIPAL